MGKKNWKLNIDDVDYNIEYAWGVFSKKLSANGQDIPMEKSKFLTGINETHFSLGSKEIAFVNMGRKIDLALDGKYISTGEDFVSIGDMPKWAWIFIILNGLILINLGALPCVIALMGILLSVQTSISPKLKTFPKVLICCLITLVCYGLLFMLIMATLSIRYK